MVLAKMLTRFVPRASRFLFVLLLGTLVSAVASATIQYKISLAQPETHFFHVSMTIPNVHDSVKVQLPVWNATYQIRDFALRAQQVRAVDERGKTLAVRKLDTSTWHIS